MSSPSAFGLPGRPPAAIVFELDNVLCDATQWTRRVWQLVARLGFDLDYRRFCRQWDREFREIACGRLDFDDACRGFLAAVGLSSGQADEVRAASGAVRHAHGERPLPGVIRTIGRLSTNGIRLGVLTDSESAETGVALRLSRIGLAGRFKSVVSSRDLGCVKPEAACYEAILSRLTVSADRAWFVGSRSRDLAGAAAVGMRTIGVNHEPDAAADVLLERFEGLVPLASPHAAALLVA